MAGGPRPGPRARTPGKTIAGAPVCESRGGRWRTPGFSIAGACDSRSAGGSPRLRARGRYPASAAGSSAGRGPGGLSRGVPARSAPGARCSGARGRRQVGASGWERLGSAAPRRHGFEVPRGCGVQVLPPRGAVGGRCCGCSALRVRGPAGARHRGSSGPRCRGPAGACCFGAGGREAEGAAGPRQLGTERPRHYGSTARMNYSTVIPRTRTRGCRRAAGAASCPTFSLRAAGSSHQARSSGGGHGSGEERCGVRLPPCSPSPRRLLRGGYPPRGVTPGIERAVTRSTGRGIRSSPTPACSPPRDRCPRGPRAVRGSPRRGSPSEAVPCARARSPSSGP